MYWSILSEDLSLLGRLQDINNNLQLLYFKIIYKWMKDWIYGSYQIREVVYGEWDKES